VARGDMSNAQQCDEIATVRSYMTATSALSPPTLLAMGSIAATLTLT
jgi:hypothetical protein